MTCKTGSQLFCYLHSLQYMYLPPGAIIDKVEKIRESSQFFLNILYFTNTFFLSFNIFFIDKMPYLRPFLTPPPSLILVSYPTTPPPLPTLFPKLKTNLECCRRRLYAKGILRQSGSPIFLRPRARNGPPDFLRAVNSGEQGDFPRPPVT